MESLKDWRKGKKTRLRLSAPRKSRTKIMRRWTKINKENKSFLSESCFQDSQDHYVYDSSKSDSGESFALDAQVVSVNAQIHNEIVIDTRDRFPVSIIINTLDDVGAGSSTPVFNTSDEMPQSKLGEVSGYNRSQNLKEWRERKEIQACPSSEEIKIEKDPIDEPLPEISAPSQQTNVINTAVIKPQTIKNKKPKKNVPVKRKTKEQLLQLLAEKEEEIKRQYKIICILQDKNRLLKKKLAIALKSEDFDLDSDDNYSVSTQMSDPKPDPCSPIPNEELPSPVTEGLDSVSKINQDPDDQIMEELVYQPDYNNKTVGTIDSTDPLMNVKEEPMYDMDDDGGGSDEEFVDTQFALSDYFPENEEQVIKQGMNLDGESNVVSDPP